MVKTSDYLVIILAIKKISAAVGSLKYKYNYLLCFS